MDAITAHATVASLEARIHVLWQRRAVDRRTYGAAWPQGRWDRLTELRALVRVARSGRRLARQTIERSDPVTLAKDFRDWTSGELVAEFGR